MHMGWREYRVCVCVCIYLQEDAHCAWQQRKVYCIGYNICVREMMSKAETVAAVKDDIA